MSTRAKNAAWCAELRKKGLLQREIMAITGLGRATVSEYLCDPDGARANARKRSYDGVCVDCGGRTSGSEGPAKTPERCVVCTAAKKHADRHWTRERIIAEIQRFVAINDRKPLATEWLRKRPSDGSPHVYTAVVQREFGTWNAAMLAAGLTAERPGTYQRSARTRQWMSEAAKRRQAMERDARGRWVRESA